MITIITYPDGETREVDFNEGAHRYKVDGRITDGVTGALSVIAKPFLIQWAAKMATEWIRDNCELLSLEDDPVAEIPYYRVVEEDLKNAKKAHSSYKDSRATEGTDLHDFIEQHIRGNEPVVPEPLWERYNAFIKWEGEVKPEYLLDLVEKPVYSRTHDYAGKPDIPCIINGEYGILDLKSGKPDAEYSSYRKTATGKFRAYSEHYYQCAAYDIAIEEETGRAAQWYCILYLDHLDKGYFMARNVQYFRESWIYTLGLSRIRKRLNKENCYA